MKLKWPAVWLPSIALLALFLACLGVPVVHHDIWHQMALIRESISLGRIPAWDLYSYAGTITPSIQHEWGAGVIAFGVATLAGAPGIAALNLGLAVFITWICVIFLRAEKVRLPMAAVSAVVCMLLTRVLFSPVVAQAYSAAFFAIELWLLRRDRQGDRTWIVWWLLVFLLWVNIHGGFVVGIGTLVAHGLEQAWRGDKWRHLLWVTAGTLALIAANPYGLPFYSYIARSLFMPRPFVTEWNPRWLLSPASPQWLAFVVSVPLFLYAIRRVGIRNMPGSFITILLTVAAARTMKLLPLYALAWLFVAPKALQQSPLCRKLESLFFDEPWTIGAACSAFAGVVLAFTLPAHPWSVLVPDHSNDLQGAQPYPVGAVSYLRDAGFRGNVMTGFLEGAYVSWKLYPHVKVSCDSRYEVAYETAWVDQVIRLYTQKTLPDWEQLLTVYPTDLVLVGRQYALSKRMASLSSWHRIYVDDSYELYERPGLSLPPMNREGQSITGTIP